MSAATLAWDYLVLTASNAAQAEAYETQLRLRRECGMLPQVREVLVVPDIGGKRIGSGGSTLLCLVRIVERERRRRGRTEGVTAILRELRILIVHAGGDSRRLPAYGPCGKIFVPLPAPGPAPVPAALFDRLVPGFLALPPGAPGRGQVVVVAGDALIRLDASQVNFSKTGLTALGCYATPEELTHAVRVVAAGESLLAPAVTTTLLARVLPALGHEPTAAGQERAGRLSELTEREVEVLRLVATGRSNAEVASVLYVSEATVKTHVSHILAKLGLRDRVQAVVAAFEAGLGGLAAG